MKRLTKVSMIGSILALAAFGASGQLVTNTIRLDENGTGFYNGVSIFGALIAADPSGGVAGPVLVYNVPGPALTIGDLVLSEGSSNPTNSDVLRFWQNNQVIFYSDREPGNNDNNIADISGLPNQLLPNSIFMLETGTEGNNGAIYQAHPGQPGWDGSGAGTYWVVVSDVPEPSSAAIMGFGVVTLALWQRRRAANGSFPTLKQN